MKDSAQIINNAFAVTNTAGVFPTQTQGSVPLGLSKLGKPIFGNQKLMNLDAPKAGQGIIQGMQEILRPIGAFSEGDHTSISKIGETAGNQDAIKSLSDTANEQNSAPFVKELHSHFGITPSQQSTVSALNLAHTFTKMSPAQKSLGMAAFALQNHILPGGENVYNKPIVQGSPETPPINTGQFLDLMNKGVNPYSLVSKYDQHTTLATLAGSQPNLYDMAGYAHNNKMLGFGMQGAEVPLQPNALAAWKHAPQFGPGAVVGTDPTKIPQGYENAGNIKGTIIASPKGTVPMTQGSIADGIVGTAAGVGGVSSSAWNNYQNWGEKPSKDIVGKNGGSALSAGLINLSKTSPFTYSANIGASLLKNVKDIPKDTGDYVAHLGGIALSRLEKGNTNSETDMAGVKMANSMKDMAAPDKLAALKLAFTTKGIQSKSDAYQLANQGYGEGRFTDSDLVAMHQVFNNIFDKPSVQGINQLISGKNHLAQIWNRLPESQQQITPAEVVRPKTPMSKEQAIAQNQAQFNAEK